MLEAHHRRIARRLSPRRPRASPGSPRPTARPRDGRTIAKWLVKRVVFGQDDHLEVWILERFVTMLANDPFTVADARALAEFGF